MTDETAAQGKASEAIEKTTVPMIDQKGQTIQYELVASRLLRFRADYPAAQIDSVILELSDEKALMRCEISMMFEGGAWHLVSAAHAEEYRGSSDVNMTSCLENCETSALGRALSHLGYGSNESIASAEEVIGAKKKQKVIEESAPGALLVLQKAAEGGTVALQTAYEGKLSKKERHAVKGYMAELKKAAANADREYEIAEQARINAESYDEPH